MGKMKNQPTQEEIEISKIRIPKPPEVLGSVIQLVGGDKMKVNCDDGKERLCRIPGSLRKRVWMHAGDLVLIEPWAVQGDERGDIRFRYTHTQAAWLKRKGFVKNIEVEDSI
jgi:translation initiation factor 1A